MQAPWQHHPQALSIQAHTHTCTHNHTALIFPAEATTGLQPQHSRGPAGSVGWGSHSSILNRRDLESMGLSSVQQCLQPLPPPDPHKCVRPKGSSPFTSKLCEAPFWAFQGDTARKKITLLDSSGQVRQVPQLSITTIGKKANLFSGKCHQSVWDQTTNTSLENLRFVGACWYVFNKRAIGIHDITFTWICVITLDTPVSCINCEMHKDHKITTKCDFTTHLQSPVGDMPQCAWSCTCMQSNV